jgi:hypothetical protein
MNRATITPTAGRVVCALISPAFSKLGYQSTTLYQHGSVLRLTLEGLGVTLLQECFGPTMGVLQHNGRRHSSDSVGHRYDQRTERHGGANAVRN